ncbi:SagB family peptide dehydrogenase [Streptomyces sp. NPDC006879]|uniref:SagB family peptide dehydrogenase n=1 Tax=Streptomyces sp. NPDC006879 TaxID=3364767 RepID=UPI003685E5BB
MGYAHEYADAILHRGRVPMEPVDFEPDWADRPRKAKFYPGAETVPLPECPVGAAGDLTRGLLRLSERQDPQAAEQATFTLPLLSGMLLDSYGFTGRRLAVQANTDLAALPHYPHANWSRGTASGGGLYPVSIYWAAGPSGPLTPGVYHYTPHHHALRRLMAGNVTGDIHAALGAAVKDGSGTHTDQFLILSIKYWQNAFKYNSFSFHAVSMDLGALLATWRIWAGAQGLRTKPVLWFDEERLGRLLGIEAAQEGVFAVVPLDWAGTSATSSPAAPSSGPAVRHRDAERSRKVLSFETLLRIQDATSAHATERPATGTLDQAGARPPHGDGQPLALPAPELPRGTGARAVLRARRSSFGRFAADRPLTAGQLATTLAACAAATLDSEAERPGGPRLTNLYAFVNHVEGLTPGAYAYHADTHTLRPLRSGPPGSFLQRNYFLANYNLEQTGAVLVPTVRTTAVLHALGDRGYRLVNGTVGAIAQTFYTAASALEIGAGVALGFDNISYVEELGLTGTDEAPLLVMLLGNERPRPADFRHEIAAPVDTASTTIKEKGTQPV